MKTRILIPACLLAAAAISGHSLAQAPIFHFDGDDARDWFGQSVQPAGDVDGDGTVDLIVGASQNIAPGHSPFPGYARVFSGADGSILYTFVGDGTMWTDGPDDHLGASVDGAGDVNGDGYADLIAGAYKDDDSGQNAGMFRVYSGIDGSTLYTVHADDPGDRQGYAVAGLDGDVDGDGLDDLLVGIYKDDELIMNGGAARVVSGLTGATLYEVYGDGHSDALGLSVALAGDLDSDGVPDFLAGAPQFSGKGYARAYSGADGSLLHEVVGDTDGDVLGWSVAGLGDVDGDSVPDFAVGATQDYFAVSQTGEGYVRVYSGADGSELFTVRGDEWGDVFGWSVSGVGDINGDGVPDLAVGAPRLGQMTGTPGYVRLFSGVDGTLLQELYGAEVGDWFGVSVSGGLDLNSDGLSEVLIGCSESIEGNEGEGYAQVHFGMCNPPPQFHCVGAPNSAGDGAEIGLTGSLSVSMNNLLLSATGCPPFHFGLFYYGPSAQQAPFGDGFRCVGGPTHRMNVVSTGPNGRSNHPVDLTKVPSGPGQITPGSTWHFQFWYRDIPAMMSLFNLSDAVRLSFCP